MAHEAVDFQMRVAGDMPASDCSPVQLAGGTRYAVTCPVCGGGFEVEQSSLNYRAGLSGHEIGSPTAIPVVCECGVDHPHRPTSELFVGCGTAWRLAL